MNFRQSPIILYSQIIPRLLNSFDKSNFFSLPTSSMPAKDESYISSNEVVNHTSNVPNNVMNRSGTICIEGNVGCGKTTLLDFFRKKTFDTYGQNIFMEPVESWRNVGGENLFQYLYKDPSRYSLAFQTYVQLTMIKLHKKRPMLMERSIYSARYCFVENLRKLNYLSRLEFNILDKWFKHLVLDDDDKDFSNDKDSEFKLLSRPKGLSIDLIVYLRCSPEKVMDRIKSRSRAEEKKISFEYIRSLHDLHEDWLLNGMYPIPAPVLILDTNCEQGSLGLLYEKAAPYILGHKKIVKSPTILSTLDDES